MCMNKLVYGRTSVYNIGYHMVWSVKYRHSVLMGCVENSLREILYATALEKGFVLKEVEVMPDHVHVFVSAKPKFSSSYIYKMLKGVSARKIFLRHPEIKKKLWKGHLWNPSTYIETIGHISEDTVKKYIQNQKRVCR